MLEMRPGCELCDADLPADAAGAYICSYECTFCAPCAEDALGLICVNCTGILFPRPPRLTDQLAAAPPIDTRTFAPRDLDGHAAVVAERRGDLERPLHLSEVVVDCADPAGLAHFYGTLMGCRVNERDSDWAYLTPVLRGPDSLVTVRASPDRSAGASLRLAFQKVPEPNRTKVRIHVDIGAVDLDLVTRRAVELGATIVNEATDTAGRFVVLRDPEGHGFCLVDP